MKPRKKRTDYKNWIWRDDMDEEKGFTVNQDDYRMEKPPSFEDDCRKEWAKDDQWRKDLWAKDEERDRRFRQRAKRNGLYNILVNIAELTALWGIFLLLLVKFL